MARLLLFVNRKNWLEILRARLGGFPILAGLLGLEAEESAYEKLGSYKRSPTQRRGETLNRIGYSVQNSGDWAVPGTFPFNLRRP